MHDRHDIAGALREIGALLQAKGESTFKVRAYDVGARVVADTENLAEYIEKGTLTALDGIGVALAGKITDLWNTGTTPVLTQLRIDVPAGVLLLLEIPGLGPTRVKVLRDQLHVHDPQALLEAAKAGRVQKLPGFSPKIEAKLIEAITNHTTVRRYHLDEAWKAGEAILAHLDEKHAQLAGSARRYRETVGDLDIVVASDAPAKVIERFVAYPRVREVRVAGDTLASIVLTDGLQVDLRVVSEADFALTLHHFTGSKSHNIVLRGRAQERGLSLSEYGLVREDGGKVAVASEAELYAALDLPFIPPELREDEGEFAAAAYGDTFKDLIELGDLRGIVHCHTTFSDGRASLEDMAKAAKKLGYAYMTITDHSPTASYAHGVERDRLLLQWDEIERVEKQVGIRLFKGTESDILQDGALDYPDELLARLDIIIASVHTRHKLTPEQSTERLIAAMQHPLYKIWGHPLGRLVEERPPIECDVEAVLDALAKSRGAVEINGDPKRLDLEPKWARLARKRGLKFVVSADAHSTEGLHSLRWGAATARRAGIRRTEVLNTLNADEFAAAVRPGS